jgi:hypothetical protein
MGIGQRGNRISEGARMWRKRRNITVRKVDQ